jgi:alpha-amylase/alpha-mannosidase (GH57 family)
VAEFVIHGHFYQPPRENPWTQRIENQPSAAPLPNWNERIFRECYRPNAHARILDERGRVLRLVNNYRHLSFNIGATLLSWMEEHHPITYAQILEADRFSVRHRGHGNALAQAFNHTILPLDHPRDQKTQIRWGRIDFERRFGRAPEGMWLSETAANAEVLELLMDEGVRFTVLSPYQAGRARPIGGHDWRDVREGRVDPTRPYRLFHRQTRDRYLDIFFYDGPKSKSVAFENVLSTSQRFLDELIAHAPSDGLVLLATDGESYGHHTTFGDRTLAHAFEMEAPRRDLRFTNLAAYLDHRPPSDEIELAPGDDDLGTSWSCAHGVGRWFRDCGCHTGGEPGWTQAWRRPLRSALELVREHAARIYEARMGAWMDDPWGARDAYIEVLGDGPDAFETWARRWNRASPGSDALVQQRTLLEMQLQSMLMFTSCGWFFNDVSGIETVQVLHYAARCMDYLDELGERSPEREFLDALGESRSNRRDQGTAADIYRRTVPRARVTPRRAAAHLGISGLLEELPTRGEVGLWTYDLTGYQKETSGPFSLATGFVELVSRRTGRREDQAFAAVHLGGIDFYVAVRPGMARAAFEHKSSVLLEELDETSLAFLLRSVFESFGPHEFRLQDMLPGAGEAAASSVFRDLIERFTAVYSGLYRDHTRTLEMLHAAGFEIPSELRMAAEFTLKRQFEEEIQRQEQSREPKAYRRAIEIAEEIERRGYRVDRTASSHVFEQLISRSTVKALTRADLDAARATSELVDLVRRLQLPVSLEAAQEALVDSGSGVSEEVRETLADALGVCASAYADITEP